MSQARVWHCLLLNGCLFLGCILWWTLALAPAVDWLASRFIAPCWGPHRADAVAAAMRLMFDVLLLLPIYAVTMAANSPEYQRVARAAHAVQSRRQVAAAHPTAGESAELLGRLGKGVQC